jgi:hypothetical protein
MKDESKVKTLNLEFSLSSFLFFFFSLAFHPRQRLGAKTVSNVLSNNAQKPV